MNREQRRRRARRADKHSRSAIDAKNAIVKIARESVKNHSPAKEIESGDIVSINYDLVTGRMNYQHMNDSYKEFVENSRDKVFTAVVEHDRLVHFQEEPKWLFWVGDLNIVKKRGDKSEGEGPRKIGSILR